MNFLAHAYLSFHQPKILVGNMISDFVKGKKKFDYPLEIQQGIMLHRAIDAFTDDHPATKEAKQYFKEAVGLYSGAFIDVAFDHFLANDPTQFSEQSLYQFCNNAYGMMQLNKLYLPDRFLQMLPYMVSQNWLFNYRNLAGIKQSFNGLARRAKYLDSSESVFEAFKTHYKPLQNCYNSFFPLVKQFAQQHLETL